MTIRDAPAEHALVRLARTVAAPAAQDRGANATDIATLSAYIQKLEDLVPMSMLSQDVRAASHHEGRQAGHESGLRTADGRLRDYIIRSQRGAPGHENAMEVIRNHFFREAADVMQGRTQFTDRLPAEVVHSIVNHADYLRRANASLRDDRPYQSPYGRTQASYAETPYPRFRVDDDLKWG